jgi:nucleotide exchange factor SIL1
MEDEENSPIIDIPTEQAMVVVEPPADIEAELEAEKPVIPSNAPVYESAGKIVPPPPTGDEMTTFTKAMTLARMDTRFFDSALSDLVDLSHDIYYGVEIIKDGQIFERLICFLLGSSSERLDAKEKDRDHKAASILASALQNNPTAMKEAANYWKFAIQPACGSDTLDKSLKPDQKDFVARLRSKLGKEREPATLRAKVGAISNLLKVPKFRDAFLGKKGMELLLAIFLKKGDEWDATRKKVSQLVMDNFLDESLGAVTGVWPKGPTVDDEVCKTRGKMLRDGCWEYHVEQFGKESGGLSWAEDFLSALKEHRIDTGKLRSEKEL